VWLRSCEKRIGVWRLVRHLVDGDCDAEAAEEVDRSAMEIGKEAGCEQNQNRVSLGRPALVICEPCLLPISNG
jgi:hypothetical protein